MRKILLTALSSVVLCVSFVACSDDDDATSTPSTPSTPSIPSTPSESDKLVGKWTYTQFVTLDADGKVVTIHPEDNGPSPLDAIEFKADGTSEEIVYDVKQDGTWYSFIVQGKWSINGNIFTLENKYTEEYGDNSIHKIVTLSDDTFEYEEPIPEKHAIYFEPNAVKFRHTYKRY